MHETTRWFIDRYDFYVSGEGSDGAELEKSRDAVAHGYADAVETGQLDQWKPDLISEGRSLFDSFVKPERTKRRGAFRKSMVHLLEALNDNTILGREDPALTMAYITGDGRDKTLFYWTAEDWSGSRTERYRNAAAVTTAAAEFDTGYAQIFIDAMKSKHVTRTGDLFAS